MTRPARLAVLVAVAALVAALSVGSGALSTATVDHHATVGVAGPGEGYLGLGPPAADAARGNATVLLAVTNRFGVPVTATARVRDGEAAGPPVVRNATGPGRLGPGETAPVTATVRCGDAARRGHAVVVVAATGRGLRVRATRRVDVVCPGPPTSAGTPDG